MHLDPPGVQWAEKSHPAKDNVANLPHDEMQLAHIPAFAGIPHSFAQVLAMVEIRNFDGFRNIFEVGHDYFQYSLTSEE
jgi:hypothetical protein